MTDHVIPIKFVEVNPPERVTRVWVDAEYFDALKASHARLLEAARIAHPFLVAYRNRCTGSSFTHRGKDIDSAIVHLDEVIEKGERLV